MLAVFTSTRVKRGMDTSKADKLAAAKKKLKQFQQKSGGRNTTAANQRENTQQEISEAECSVVVSNNDGHPITSDLPSIGKCDTVTMTSENVNEPLLKEFENLKKEKEDILLSLKSSQDNVRNLVAQLEEERKISDDARERLTLLEKAYSDRKESKEEELKHTVSIIVQEKNELSVAHKECQEQLKKSEHDILETTKQLNAARLVFEDYKLSRDTEITGLKFKVESLSSELEKANEELRNLNMKHTDLNDEFVDLSSRHTKSEKDLIERDSQIKDLTLQLELSNLNLQQMRNAGPPTVDQSLELMQKENRQLLEQIQLLREQQGKISVEKDVLAQQYEQYISRLNGQIRSLTSQVETIATEKRNAEASLTMRNDSIKTLENTVAELRKEVESHSAAVNSDVEAVKLVDDKLQESSDCANTMEELRKKIQQITLHNEQLAKLVLEKESHIQELEIKIDRIQNELSLATANQDTSEREKLLQAMQSDKTAAARAISQNRQLKVQLEELEKAFIQLSNDKLVLTEQSQSALRQNKELHDRLAVLEPELLSLREQVNDLAGQRDATIYWKQELEEAHERIQALSHQNSELKKRVVWNLSQKPIKNGRKHTHDVEGSEGVVCNHSDTENDEDDWVSNEKYQKLLFHYGELEKQHKKSLATIASLNEEKKRLDHLVIQLQSETETIGEYVSLYQVQRGVLKQRAEQLAKERQILTERIENLKLLMPILAPSLKDNPDWSKLTSATVDSNVDSIDDLLHTHVEPSETGNVAADIVRILQDITSSNSTDLTGDTITQTDSLHFERNECLPHENFHPCQVCSGRLMTV